MKKLFIGLLIIAAAGAGVYYYLRIKQQNSPAVSPGISKEIPRDPSKTHDTSTTIPQKDSVK